MSGNGDSVSSPTQPGCLCEEPGTYSIQGTLDSPEAYPYKDGTFYGFDTGAADDDLRNSDDANIIVLLPPVAYNSVQGLVDIGAATLSRQKHVEADDPNRRYYKTVVPVVIPSAFEPLPNM
jgi:hypothetical protein